MVVAKKGYTPTVVITSEAFFYEFIVALIRDEIIYVLYVTPECQSLLVFDDAQYP